MAGELSNYQPLPVTDISGLPTDLQTHAQLNGGGYYVGYSPSSPQIGDLRIGFQIVGPTDISIVAKQTGNTFEPYQAKAGGTIDLLETGIKSADAMFKSAHQSNTIMTWLIRIGALILMTIGLNMMVRPLSVIADVIPAIGSIVGAGTGLIAFLLALVLSLITIAIAWIFYRPLIGIGLLVVAGAAIFLTRARVKQAAPAARPAAATLPPGG
jgi:hypothetical protein